MSITRAVLRVKRGGILCPVFSSAPETAAAGGVSPGTPCAVGPGGGRSSAWLRGGGNGPSFLSQGCWEPQARFPASSPFTGVLRQLQAPSTAAVAGLAARSDSHAITAHGPLPVVIAAMGSVFVLGGWRLITLPTPWMHAGDTVTVERLGASSVPVLRIGLP